MGQKNTIEQKNERIFREPNFVEKTYFEVFAPTCRFFLPENRFLISLLLKNVPEGSTLEKELLKRLKKKGFSNIVALRKFPSKNRICSSKLNSLETVYQTILEIAECSSSIVLIQVQKELEEIKKKVVLQDLDIKRLSNENTKLMEENQYLERDVNNELHSELLKLEEEVRLLKKENSELSDELIEFQKINEELVNGLENIFLLIFSENEEFRKTLDEVIKRTGYGKKTPRKNQLKQIPWSVQSVPRDYKII